ncbi:MAG: PglZ domain-containing protein [Saprospiraceae bacterium]|nr:PglZ domain-containing protein [Saprospiraceae bacterium]
MADKIRILWADDEIDMLKPQLFFLEKKGYEVITVTNGHDALDILDEDNAIDVVFLDESMPGLSGLDTLARIKNDSKVPVVMITKNEAENIMEQAIGSKIDDYLIKPVNPNQILLTLKKLIDNKRLISEKTAIDYQQEFRTISMDINSNPDYEAWVTIYKKLISWEIKLDESNNPQMYEILDMQKREANKEFSKYIINNYQNWIKKETGPVTSNNLLRKYALSHINESTPTVLLLLDNLRYDQWKTLEPIISEVYKVESEDYFYSILPTATQYSRNAIFSGMMPRDIEKSYPDWWLNDNEEGGKNLKEEDLMKSFIKRALRKDIKSDYIKVTNVNSARNLQDNITNVLTNDFTAIVYNFIDMLSHSRTELDVIKELAPDEKAYRSVTRSWFLNSPLWGALQKLAEKDINLIITTDHGTIRVKQPSKVVGDRETTTNLRYKVGRNLQYDRKDVLEIRDPHEVGLPKPNVSSSFIFAKEDLYFLYPNNYNYYNNYYYDTFQHGGISMEEMICPIISLKPR